MAACLGRLRPNQASALSDARSRGGVQAGRWGQEAKAAISNRLERNDLGWRGRFRKVVRITQRVWSRLSVHHPEICWTNRTWTRRTDPGLHRVLTRCPTCLIAAEVAGLLPFQIFFYSNRTVPVTARWRLLPYWPTRLPLERASHTAACALFRSVSPPFPPSRDNSPGLIRKLRESHR